MDELQQPGVITTGDDFLIQKIGYLLLSGNTLSDLKSLNIVFEHKKDGDFQGGETVVRSTLEQMESVDPSHINSELHKQVKDIVRHLRALKEANALSIAYSEVLTLAKMQISTANYEEKYQKLRLVVMDDDGGDLPTASTPTTPLCVEDSQVRTIKNLYDSYLFIVNTAWGIISDAINKAEEKNMVKKMEQCKLPLGLGVAGVGHTVSLMDEQQKDLYGLTRVEIRKDTTWFAHINRRIDQEDEKELGFGDLWFQAIKKTFTESNEDVLQSADLEAKYGGRFFYPPPSLLR